MKALRVVLFLLLIGALVSCGDETEDGNGALVEFGRFGGIQGAAERISIFADGRLVTELGSKVHERNLSEAELRDAIDAVGPARDNAYLEQAPDTDPECCDVLVLYLRHGDRFVDLEAMSSERRARVMAISNGFIKEARDALRNEAPIEALPNTEDEPGTGAPVDDEATS